MSASHSVSVSEKEAYIRTTYHNWPGLSWEKKLRDQNQLVSEIIPNLKEKKEVDFLLINMLEREASANKAAFKVVQSRKGLGFRIIVDLNDIVQVQEQTTSLQQIVNFLNNVHAPLVIAPSDDLPWGIFLQGPVPLVETENFQCEWEVQKDKIVMVGPSLHYGGPIGSSVKDALRTQFSEKAKSAGFDDAFIVLFNKSLISEDHKNFGHSFCDHYFKNPDFIAQLGKLAKHFENAQCRHYAEKATAAAFSTKLPEFLGLHVLGKFASVSDAANLACVNRKARAQAKAGKELDDKKASQKVTMKPGK